jgi:penicillin-binding protein 2
MKNLGRLNRKRIEPVPDAERLRGNGGTRLPKRDEGDLGEYKRKALYSFIVVILFFSVIVARLWFLQVEQGDYYNQLADSNRVRSVEIAAPRGNIYDLKGREIVTNRPSFNVVWMRESNKINDEWLKHLTRLLRQDTATLLDKIRKMAGTPGHLPVRLAEDIDWETVARIENNRMYLPEIKIEVVPLRIYHFGNLASHLIGYMGEISKAELDKADKTLYKGGDLIGKMGLERLREKDLRGEKGHENMEVNALGFEQQTLKGDEPMPGKDLYLTIDVELQKIAEAEMAAKNWAGAVVAMEANTGRVLVSASAPELHLEEFVGGISQKAWQGMLDNPLHPLVNKVVQGQYPPASTHKSITAFAGLAEGVITPDTHGILSRPPPVCQQGVPLLEKRRTWHRQHCGERWRNPAMFIFIPLALNWGLTGWPGTPKCLAWARRPGWSRSMKNPGLCPVQNGRENDTTSSGTKGRPCRCPLVRDTI